MSLSDEKKHNEGQMAIVKKIKKEFIANMRYINEQVINER